MVGRRAATSALALFWLKTGFLGRKGTMTSVHPRPTGNFGRTCWMFVMDALRNHPSRYIGLPLRDTLTEPAQPASKGGKPTMAMIPTLLFLSFLAISFFFFFVFVL